MTDTSFAAIKAWALDVVTRMEATKGAGHPAMQRRIAIFRAVAGLADLATADAAEIARLRARPTWAQGVEAAAAEVVRLRMEFCNDRYATQPEGSRGERVACNWIEAAIRALKEPT